MGLSTDAYIGHVEGHGPCLRGAELEGFRKVLERIKEDGSGVAIVGNYMRVVMAEHMKDKYMPPYVFNCERCQETATALVDEVLGGHAPPPLQEWCGQEYDEEKDASLRKLFKMLKDVGVGATMHVVGCSLQARIKGHVVDMAEFNCVRCLDKIKATVTEVFDACLN